MKDENFLYCRFYEELNNFLPSHQRKREFTYSFKGSLSIKQLTASLGVPDSEVELILLNGKSVDFDYRLKNNDRISVYPMFESIDISSELKVRTQPLRMCGETSILLNNVKTAIKSYIRTDGMRQYNSSWIQLCKCQN